MAPASPSGGQADRRVAHHRAAELEALERHGVRTPHNLDQHAPRALMDAEHGAGVAPAQEVDLPGLQR
jgi:hypothetical protein